jgi:hypothetical protein
VTTPQSVLGSARNVLIVPQICMLFGPGVANDLPLQGRVPNPRVRPKAM